MVYNEPQYVRDLINKYRAEPNMFDDSQLDVLQQKADQYNIPFKPLRDTTTLGSLARNFTGGFVRGLVPLVPPDDKPRTTYEAIAQSLGHLAGFAPSILSVPLRGATTVAKAGSRLLGLTKLTDKIDNVKKLAPNNQGFIGMKTVATLDKIALPMIASRFAKRGIGRGISKLELDAIETFKKGGAGLAITEEAIGLGAASVVSNVWAGPDEYINTFFGGALAGGLFGGIGNYIAIGNRLKFAKGEKQRKAAEQALRGALGAAVTGLPATLRDEPIEMQLYEYLLGGFFGYKSRPAHEAVGGAHIAGMDATNKSLMLKPELSKNFENLNKQTQEYVLSQSTREARNWLERHSNLFEGLSMPDLINKRVKSVKSRPEQKDIDRAYRDLAYETYNKVVDKLPSLEINKELIDGRTVDTRDDVFNDYIPTDININKLSRDISRDLKSLNKLKESEYDLKIKDDINEFFKTNVFNADGSRKKAGDVETFINTLKRDEFYGNLFNAEYKKQNNIKRNYEKEFRRLFHQGSTIEYKTQVFDWTSKDAHSVYEIEPTRIENVKLGVRQFIPGTIIDSFGGVDRGFNYLHYFRTKGKRDKKPEYKDISEIFKINIFSGKKEYPQQYQDMVNSLHSQNKYIYAGVKDKPFLITAEYNDRNNTLKLKDILNVANFNKEQTDKIRESYKKSLIEFKKEYKGEKSSELHERRVVSNIMHELKNQGFEYNKSDIRKLFSENYFKNAVDFNKRMQGYAESSGVPMHQNSFIDSVKNGIIRTVIARDIDFDPYPLSGNKPSSATDGASYFRQDVHRDINRSLGNKENYDNVKPVRLGKYEDSINNTQLGIMFGKTSGKRATGPIEKLLNELDAHQIIFESGNKIKGQTKSIEFKFNEKENRYIIGDGSVEAINHARNNLVNSARIETLRINPNTYENSTKNVQGINLPRQFLSTLTSNNTPKGLTNFIKHYFKTPKVEQEMVNRYNKTNNIKEIQIHLEKDFSNLDRFPVEFIFKKLADKGKDGDVIRRALQKTTSADDPLIEDNVLLGNRKFDDYHNALSDFNLAAQGSWITNNVAFQMKNSYNNAVRKYFLKRMTTPFWEYGSKGWLNGVTKDIFIDADMVKNRRIEQGEVLLDTGHRNMNVVLDINGRQKERLNTIIANQKGKVVNESNASTLGSIWDAYKYIRKGAGTGNADLQKVLENAFDLLVIRVPSDSVSGTRVLKFKGFTRQKGTGITTHRTDDKYLGGADKDADSAFIIQGGQRNHILELSKESVKLQREKLNETQLMESLGAKEFDTADVFSKFSPSFREKAYETGRQGADNRGQFISARDALSELYERVKVSPNKQLKSKLFVNETLQDITISLKKNGFKKFQDDVYGFINIANDSTKYIKIPSIKDANIRLLKDLFVFKNKQGSEISAQQIYKYKLTSADNLKQPKIKSDLEKLYAFHSGWKTHVYDSNRRSLESLKQLFEQYKNDKFYGPIGRTFKNSKFTDIQDIDALNEFRYNLSRSASKFTNDKDSVKFLETLIKDTSILPLSKFQDTYKKGGSKDYNKLLSDLDVNLNKISSYELLTENALIAFNSFSPSKKNNYSLISNQLNKLYNKANKIKQDYNNDLYNEAIAEVQSGQPLKPLIDKKTESSIGIETIKIKRFANNNNLDNKGYNALKRFFDTALLLPYQAEMPNGKLTEFFKTSGRFWSSKEIAFASKKDLLDRNNKIFQDQLTAKEVTGKPEFEIPIASNKYYEPLTKKYTEIVSNVDKAKSIEGNIVDTVLKGKNVDKDNLDILAFNDKDINEVRLFRENIKKYPAIDSINDYFIEFTYRNKGAASDLSTASISDIRAMNQNFRWIERGQKDKFKWLNWLRDPRDIAERDLAPSMVKTYEKKINVKTRTGTKQQPLARHMSPLASMRDYFVSVRLLQDKILQNEKDTISNRFDFSTWMTKNDQITLTELISNKRNPEEARLSGKTYTDFLNKKFKNARGETKTGQEWFEFYDNRVTEFYDRMGKEFIYTYKKDGEKFEFNKVIDVNNPKFGKVNDYIIYGKDGQFDFNNFYKKVIEPVKQNILPKNISIEQLLRFQFEYSMEKDLRAKFNTNKVTLAQRTAYRTNEKTSFNNMRIGRIEPSEYWSRLNYGHNTQSRLAFEKSAKNYARTKAETVLNQGGSLKEAEKVYANTLESLHISREKSLNNSARLEDQFLDKQYEDVGYNSKSPNLLERNPEIFLDGYDKTPNVFSSYNERMIRSLFSNLSAIYGNREIDVFRNGNKMDVELKLNKDIIKHNQDVELKAQEILSKTQLDTGSLKLAKQKSEDYKNRNRYKNNTDLWSDFLYIYLKNSLGHPSLLTNRIQKSVAGADPLKLKYNPYYFTSDYAVTAALERLYKNDKFNKMPFLRNAPEGKEARRDYFVRRLHDLGALEARMNLMTILANTGTMTTNLYGGAAMNISSAGLKNFVDSKRNSVVVKKLLTDINGNFVLKTKDGKSVKNRKDFIKYLNEEGIIDNYLAQAEIDYNQSLKDGIGKLGANSKNFIRDLRKATKENNQENIIDIVNRYGIKDTMTKYGGFFMQFSERINRTDAFISHALQAKENLGRHGIHVNMKDPYIFETALKGIETTQFLYHNSFRPAFMTTALGKVLTRFKLFAFQSVRVRQEFYRKAKLYGFNEGTPEYKKYKDLFLTDMFTMALAGAFMYSIFDTALAPPYDWYQDTADLLFGDKKERDRAFYGTLPRPIAPLQAAMPPVSRYPGAIVELISGDWQKFSDYTIHTMYPFGRLVYSTKKSLDPQNRKGFIENFFRIPISKVSYRIKREQELEERQEYIDEILGE